MEIVETVYEDMTIKNGQTLITKSKKHIPMKDRRSSSLDAVCHEYEVMHQRNDEAEEDIYEVIPADYAPNLWSEKTSRSSSISSQGSARSERNCMVTTIGIQTEDESTTLPANVSPNQTTAPSVQDAQNTEHYAEILHATDLKINEIIPSRPTRESANPILRQDFAQLTNTLSPELESIRNSFVAISKQLDSQGNQAKRELPAHLLLKRSLSTGDNRNGFVRKYVDVLYENTIPQPHQCASVPVYENMKFPYIESDRESHCSINSSSTEGRSISSEDDSSNNVESLYENVAGDYTEERRQRTSSRPIDIVYSDLEFHNGEKRSKFYISSSDSDEASQKNCRSTKSLSAVPLSNPSPPSPKGSGLTRPKSLNLRSRVANEALGMSRARFVKKVSVQRCNDKTLQATISEVLSKHNDEETEPCVNVEVNSDLVRISTDFPPWEVIASCNIETVGHVNLYEGDENVLGIIVCPLGEESTCYIVRSRQATNILENIKVAFTAPNLRQFNLRSSPEGTPPPALPGYDSYTSIPHITYLGCVKVKKSYLVINDSISTLLDKLNPKDFKPITLNIRPEEILIIDESTQTTLYQHSISWVLSLGVFSDDSRLFGYIVTEARQGEKTRMFCHAFRCGRVTASVTASETIRLACQATFSPARKDSLRTRRDSQRSLRSSYSSDASSSLERHSSMCDFTEIFDQCSSNERRHSEDSGSKHKSTSPGRLLRKLTPKKNKFKSSFRSYTSEPNLASLTSSPTEENPVTPDSPPADCPEIIEEKEYTFKTSYLCSTVINPPLRPKHVRNSVKQYLKECKKRKNAGTSPTEKEVELCVTSDGVTMLDPECRHVGQRFFPFPCISDVRTHKDYPGYFAFSTVVTGDTKHKCHIFKEVKEPCDEITTAFQYFLWEKV